MSEFSEPLDFFGCSGSTKSERSDEREGRREDRRDDRSSTRPSLSHQVSDDGEACLACIHELRRTDALEQAISGATHDFNNMLGCVVAAVELIYTRIQRGQYTDLETLFEDVHRTCERSSLLASRLMDFSAPRRPVRSSVDINQIIDDMAPLLRRTLGNMAICRLHLDERLPPVWCDANELENALLNLFTNSRDAVSGRLGVVAIETSNAALAVPRHRLVPGNHVCLMVSDNGSGMSSETLKRAFEPFVTTKRRGRGRGLGLPMVRRFVEESDGHVEIESTIDKGTVIRIYLPSLLSGSGSVEPAASIHAEHRV